MSEDNSPMFKVGLADGLRDAARVSICPPLPPLGPEPPHPDYPVMYLRGYHREFDVAVPHVCTDKCRKEAS